MTTRETLPSVAVLGLGRMGGAMARRLHEAGHPVVTWSRSGRAVDDLPIRSVAAEAAAGADVVLMCLFDGAACAEVVASLRGHLSPGQVVVNTSTVGVEEAVALATAAGPAGYVHAPVMGSVPAVLAGTLTVLHGADAGDDAASGAPVVLGALGNVLRCGTVAGAAAAKLLANGVLGGAVLGLRDALERADELGIERGRALSVLERTVLGRLVTAKRPALEKGEHGDADFTVAALAKDLALLAAGAPSAAALRDEVGRALATGAVGPDDDIVSLAAGRVGDTARPHRLTVAPGVTAPPAVLAPLEAYVEGHATGDPAHHRRAFLPTAHVEGVRDGRFASWTLDDYCAVFTGRPAADEERRRRRVDRVEVSGTVATATMTLHHGADVFTDVFLLVQADGEWRIANKVYDRRSA